MTIRETTTVKTDCDLNGHDHDPKSDHRGALAILGPRPPRLPFRHFFLAGKAAAACAVALLIDGWTGNPDHVSSTFVAVLAVSPVVLMGLRRSFDQIVGSGLGGLLGAGAMLAGLELGVGIPLAVGLSILASFALGFGRGYTVAAFSALFVQAVPWGDVFSTLEVRLLAVTTAVVSAFIVNTVISAAAYESIFRRRYRLAQAAVSSLLVRAAEQGPAVVQEGFPMLATLEYELDLAIGELRWRRATDSCVFHLRERVGLLRRLLHLVLDLVYRLEEEELPPDSLQPWLQWLIARGGEEPEVPEALKPTTQRIRRLGRSLRSDGPPEKDCLGGKP